MGEKCVFVRVGKAFLCTKKGYYTPLIIGRRCRIPVPLWWEWKTGVALGFRSIGKNCACAGGKMLPEVMCCLEREKNAPNIEL